MAKFFVLFTAALFAFSIPLSADDAILSWGADLEGGQPGVYANPEAPDEIIGFEKDIVDELAKRLNLTPHFTQNQWEGMIPGLKRGLYDIIVGEVVVTPQRRKEVDFSLPYYIGRHQIVVGEGIEGIESLADLKGRRVASLKESDAASVLKKYGIKARLYANESPMFEDLSNGRTEAIVIDDVVAQYFALELPALRVVGDLNSSFEYAIVLRKGSKAFLAKINTALQSMIDDGTLRRILDDWKLWNPQMAEYTEDFSEPSNPHRAYNTQAAYSRADASLEDMFKRYSRFLPKLGRGAMMTVWISLAAMVLAVLLGFALAILRVYAPRILSIPATCFIEWMRGTPLLIQLYFIFYGLPHVGVRFDPMVAGIIALGLNYAAYEAENYRAGLLAVPRGQIEAARALGMTHWQSLRHVVMPQAFRIVIPPVTNDFISLLKDSALVSVITLVDLTYAYTQIASSTYDFFGTGLLVAVIYFLLGLPFVQIARWAERRLCFDKRHRRRSQNLII